MKAFKLSLKPSSISSPSEALTFKSLIFTGKVIFTFTFYMFCQGLSRVSVS